MAQLVKITITYPHEDTTITVEEEMKHWRDGTIDVATINDGCEPGEEICTVDGEIVDAEGVEEGVEAEA